MFEKLYKNGFMTGEKNKCSPDMSEKEKKKYIFECRTIKEYVIGYKEFSFHENYHRCKYIVCIANGSMVVDVVVNLKMI